MMRVAVGFAILASTGASIAVSAPEAPPGCRLDDGSTSLLRIYECQEKLRIAAETATRVAAIERNGQLVGLRVEGGAVLVETAGRREGFRIVTAEAVTEVRAATVAVDTASGKTSVFVQDGGVSVSQDGRTVSLGAGQGIDLDGPPPAERGSTAVPRAPSPHAPPPAAARPSPQPAPPVSSAAPSRAGRGGLEVKTWSRERAGTLMARLGQR